MPRTIVDIYQLYSIPINLQEHMLRVAAVGEIVCRSLHGVSFDESRVITTLLLHDMGNILKFKFERTELFAPEDQDRVTEMQAIQHQFQKKYGNHPDDATEAIMRELGVEERAIELCHRAHGDRLDKILVSNDWEEKIVIYGDMRVGPFGLLPIEDRFADLMVRYAHKSAAIQEQSHTAQKLEVQLQSYSTIDLRAISEQDLEPIIAQLRYRGIE